MACYMLCILLYLVFLADLPPVMRAGEHKTSRIVFQSISGLRSSHLTPVTFSMRTQRSSGTPRVIQLAIVWDFVPSPSNSASFVIPPAFSIASRRAGAPGCGLGVFVMLTKIHAM